LGAAPPGVVPLKEEDDEEREAGERAAGRRVGVGQMSDAELLEGEAGGAGGGAGVGEAAENQGMRAEGDADGLAAARTGRAAGGAELEDGGTGGGGERGEDEIAALDGGGMPGQPGGEGDGKGPVRQGRDVAQRVARDPHTLVIGEGGVRIAQGVWGPAMWYWT